MKGIHRAMAGVAALLAVAAALAEGSASTPRVMDAFELAGRIMRQDAALRVFDLRSRGEFEQFHVAGARHMTLGTLRTEPLPAEAAVVFYAGSTARATRGWSIAHDRGADAYVLRGGVQEWFVRVYEPRLAADATPAERAEFERAAALSRFFGGKPQVDVPRSQLLAAATIRRRGC